MLRSGGEEASSLLVARVASAASRMSFTCVLPLLPSSMFPGWKSGPLTNQERQTSLASQYSPEIGRKIGEIGMNLPIFGSPFRYTCSYKDSGSCWWCASLRRCWLAHYHLLYLNNRISL